MATAHTIHAFLGFTSTRLGSEVSCPRTLPRKNLEDPLLLEPRTPGLRVKHFTTEPRGTLVTETKVTQRRRIQRIIPSKLLIRFLYSATGRTDTAILSVTRRLSRDDMSSSHDLDFDQPE